MDPERARELVQRERERIEHSLRELAPEDDGELGDHDQHLADDATELYQNELDEGFGDQLQRDLEAVERAEQRLADGTYGLSVESGEPIADDRLEAQPTAERTVEEEERLGR